MTCKRTYQCDLCHGTLSDAPDGIGIRWGAGDQIKAVFFADSERHLCNRCVAGLREMFADLDKITQMYRDLDAAGRDEQASA